MGRAEDGPPATPGQGPVQEIAAKLHDFLQREGIDPAELGSVEKVTSWDALAKGGEGEPTRKERMFSVQVDPQWRKGPEWPVIQPGHPVKPPKPSAPRFSITRGWKTAFIEPDCQFGVLRLLDGRAIPLHDPRALDASEQFAYAVRPHNYINLGDYVDLAEMSSYRQDPTLVRTTQPAIDAGHRHLSIMVEASRNEDDWVHEGNHDQRLQQYLLDNAMAAFGLRPANTPPDHWPQLSLPALLRFDELHLEYVSGYPADVRHINANIYTRHGIWLGNKSKTATQEAVEAERESVVFGHIHKVSTAYKTRNTRSAMKQNMAHSPGCLCHIDGRVPSGSKYVGKDVYLNPKRSWEDWQQGVTLVHYVPDDGPFRVEHVPIIEGELIYGGQVFRSELHPDHLEDTILSV